MTEIAGKEEGTQSQLDSGKFRKDFETRRSIYRALLDEVVFILQDAVDQSEIKIHSIEHRVKDETSIIKKCIDNGYSDPFMSLVDIAAARVICLFRSDLEKIGGLIGERFDVFNRDDKINESTDSFGYMSVHYVCKMKEGYSGPRYEKIKNINFEIQVRTLSMHAWAAISHYLEYKGEWDVPAHLRKSLNALSGLFYVADSEFEQFYLERERSRNKILKNTGSLSDRDEINLDTVKVYLLATFPDRRHADEAGISELVREIKAAGYTRISEINEEISRARDAFAEYEKMFPPVIKAGRTRRYADIGAVRTSLSIASDTYIAHRGTKISSDMIDEYKSFRHLLKPKK